MSGLTLHGDYSCHACTTRILFRVKTQDPESAHICEADILTAVRATMEVLSNLAFLAKSHAEHPVQIKAYAKLSQESIDALAELVSFRMKYLQNLPSSEQSRQDGIHIV